MDGSKKITVINYPLNVMVIENVLDEDEVRSICSLFENADVKSPVSIQGRTDVVDYRVGSVRTTSWCENIAKQLGDKILNQLPILKCDDYFPTEMLFLISIVKIH